jgi:hypothetical protein
MTNPSTQTCGVCRGAGVTYVEHSDGTLSETACPYCRGRKTNAWVPERAQEAEKSLRGKKGMIAGYLGFLVLTNGWEPWGLTNTTANTWLYLFHIGLWFLGIVGLVWWWLHRKARQPSEAQQRRDRFTTDDEKGWTAITAGGTLLKGKWDHNHKQ